MPPKKVTADMPMISESGPEVMTLVTASSVLAPISRAPAMKLSLLTASALGVKMRL